MSEHDGGNDVDVTFRLPAEAGAERAWLVGEFNRWSVDRTELVRQDDGSLAVTVALPPGRYRFRYYLGEGRWENAWDAEAYAENEYGGSDSVVIVRSQPEVAAPPAPQRAARKTPAKATTAPAAKKAAKPKSA